MPRRISRILSRESVPICSRNWALSIVAICDTFTTLCSGVFPSPGASNTFPGSRARRRLEVSPHTTTVFILLLLKTSF